jgi:hypothetical protein
MWWSRCRPPRPFPLGAQQGHTASPSAPRRVNRPPHPVPRTERARACTGEVARSNGGTGSPTRSWPFGSKVLRAPSRGRVRGRTFHHSAVDVPSYACRRPCWSSAHWRGPEESPGQNRNPDPPRPGGWGDRRCAGHRAAPRPAARLPPGAGTSAASAAPDPGTAVTRRPGRAARRPVSHGRRTAGPGPARTQPTTTRGAAPPPPGLERRGLTAGAPRGRRRLIRIARALPGSCDRARGDRRRRPATHRAARR